MMAERKARNHDSVHARRPAVEVGDFAAGVTALEPRWIREPERAERRRLRPFRPAARDRARPVAITENRASGLLTSSHLAGHGGDVHLVTSVRERGSEGWHDR